MGFFSRLFGHAPDPAAGERALLEGRAKLWTGETAEAEKLLSHAVRAQPEPALALAYRTLLKRMKTQVPAALKDADRALAILPRCFEAHAARAVAFLTDRSRLPDAMAAYDEAGRHSPHDAEGHHLNMVVYLLFVEMLLNADERADEVILTFRLTPVTRGATRLLDGHPSLALEEFQAAEDSPLSLIGRGLALYRLGHWTAAAVAFQRVVPDLQAGIGDKYALSLKRLLLEAQKGR
jgi:tetratricopeptide (TPR) repeat protein